MAKAHPGFHNPDKATLEHDFKPTLEEVKLELQSHIRTAIRSLRRALEIIKEKKD